MKLATAQQMREMDRRAPAEFGVSGLELMERAGLAAYRVAREMLGSGREVLILCGKGNNGGDGFVIARLLQRAGYRPQAWLAGSADALDGDAKVNHDRAVRSGVPVREVTDSPPPLPRADLIVDALLGTGLASDVREPHRALIEAANDSGVPILAVDVPSGLNSDTGQPCGTSIQASKTVTFVMPKVGLALYPGLRLTGEVIVADIGMPEPLRDDPALTMEWTTAAMMRGLLPPPGGSTHKGDRGKVLVIAGAEGFTGAACLSAETAFRAGSGLVYLACPRSLNDIYEVKLTEVITLPVPEPQDRRCFGVESVEAVAEEVEKVDAVIFGPGLSRNDRTAAFFRGVLPKIREREKPTIIDADGLNLLADHPDTPLPEHCVLTPHPGEMGRLLGCGIKEVQADRIQTARRAVQQYGCVVLLKGPGTVIAAPNGRISLNPTGTPGLGTAGTGDVLSGTIGSLLGRGLSAYDAARASAYLQGLAGEIGAETWGEEGMMAGDVLRSLPFALQRVRDPRYRDIRSCSG
ncbi:MAG: NAD(P)H-hydrate dehydratase [Armatimonadetes bacterium]|nr:NAD(P)H-hydrate dehydratase [Armatimonadota bacterium]